LLRYAGFWIGSFCLSGCGRTAGGSAINWFHKRAGVETARPFPWFQPALLIRDEIATTHHFAGFQTPKMLRDIGWRGGLGLVHRRRFGCATRRSFTIFLGRIQIWFHRVIFSCFVPLQPARIVLVFEPGMKHLGAGTRDGIGSPTARGTLLFTRL